MLRDYKHEITAFLANAAATTNAGQHDPTDTSPIVKLLRTTSPLNHESLASFSHRLKPDRANPYFKPLGYNKVKQGLESFANTPCSAGITATLPPASQVANDPNFNVRTGGDVTAATDFYNRLKEYPFAGVANTNILPSPPCKKQGAFKSIGRFPEFTPYLHVRREP